MYLMQKLFPDFSCKLNIYGVIRKDLTHDDTNHLRSVTSRYRHLTCKLKNLTTLKSFVMIMSC